MSAVFDWARVENLQPEPVTVEMWKQLHEDFRQLVEVTNGNIIRTRESTRTHRAAVGRIADGSTGAIFLTLTTDNLCPTGSLAMGNSLV